MAINRLNRDQILQRALDLADSPTLDVKDRPGGIIHINALSITWLQEALDLFHKRFPFSADIKTTTLNLAVLDKTFTVPSDFILDYKDGIILADDEGRLRRRSLSRILDQTQGTTVSPLKSVPKIYSIRGTTGEIYPRTDKARTATLYYYALPAVLAATDVPIFPDDAILVQYVYLRAQEWHRVAQPGTALGFAYQQISDLQKAGIGSEAEEDQIPLGEELTGQFVEDPFVKVTS